MTLQELITDLKAAGANENTVRLAMNCYELGRQDARNSTWTQTHWTEYEHSIVAAEREACADMVFRYISQTVNMEARGCLASVAYDIRARGTQ